MMSDGLTAVHAGYKSMADIHCCCRLPPRHAALKSFENKAAAALWDNETLPGLTVRSHLFLFIVISPEGGVFYFSFWQLLLWTFWKRTQQSSFSAAKLRDFIVSGEKKSLFSTGSDVIWWNSPESDKREVLCASICFCVQSLQSAVADLTAECFVDVKRKTSL